MKNALEHIDYNFLFKRQSVGSYFESLIIQLLQQHTYIDLLGYNIVITDNTITLTELDIIYKYNNVLYHTELSYKYYLYDPSSKHDPWVGPNKKDTLTRRLNKFNYQLDDRHNESIYTQLQNTLESPLPVHHDFLLKGRIFLPAGHTLPAQHDLHDKRPVSYYYHLGNLPDFIHTEGYYRPLLKLEWLAPIVDQSNHNLLRGDALLDYVKAHFAQTNQSILVAQLQPDGEKYRECHRFYVVHDAW